MFAAIVVIHKINSWNHMPIETKHQFCTQPWMCKLKAVRLQHKFFRGVVGFVGA